MSNQVFPTAVRGLAYTVVKSMEDSATIQEAPTFRSTRFLRAQNPRWHWRLEYAVLFDRIVNPNPSLVYTDFRTLLGFCQSMYNTYDDFLYSDPDDNLVGPGVITAVWQANFPYMMGTIIIDSVTGHAQQVLYAPAGTRSGFVKPTFSSGGGTVTDGGITWIDIGAATNGGTNWPNPQATLQVVTDGTNYYSPLQRNLGGQFLEDITDLNGVPTVYVNGVPTSAYTLGFGGLALPGFSSSGMYLKWGTSAPTTPVTATFNYYFRVRFDEDIEDFEKFVDSLWSIGGEVGVHGKGYLTFTSSPPTSLGVALPVTGMLGSAPSPPVTPCGPNLQRTSLYPQNIQLFSFSGFGNMSYGQAGPQNYTFQRMQTSGGLIVGSEPKTTFSNFRLPPNIPAQLVQCVYLYIAWTHKADPRNATAQSSCVVGGTPIIGGFSSTATETGLFIQRIDGGGIPANTFPFSQVAVSVQLVRSLGPSFNLDDELTASVQLVVFYI